MHRIKILFPILMMGILFHVSSFRKFVRPIPVYSEASFIVKVIFSIATPFV